MMQLPTERTVRGDLPHPCSEESDLRLIILAVVESRANTKKPESLLVWRQTIRNLECGLCSPRWATRADITNWDSTSCYGRLGIHRDLYPQADPGAVLAPFLQAKTAASEHV